MIVEAFRGFGAFVSQPLLLVGASGEIVASNPAGDAFLRRVAGETRAGRLGDLVASGEAKLDRFLQACCRTRGPLPGVLELRDGVRHRVEGGLARPAGDQSPALLLLRVREDEDRAGRFLALNRKIEELSVEVRERREVESLLQAQNSMLELVVQSAAPGTVLNGMMELIECRSPDGTLGSILLLEEGRRLRHGAAPSLPAAYSAAIDGVEIGEGVGSCGTSAWRRQPVIVADIENDPLWADFRELALGHGLRACWSTPILSARGEVLGTFAMYYSTPRAPSARDQRLIDMVTRTAAIVIERGRADEERARLLEREREARELAEQASRLKDEFLATLSHELRTPLTSVLGWTRLLLLDERVEGENREALGAIERSSRHQAQMIEDLLDVSRIITGKMSVEPQPVSLTELVADSARTLAHAAEAKEIRIAQKMEMEDGQVMADPARIQQVVWNLLSNAIKFSPKGSEIEIGVRRVGSTAEIHVTDRGEGIPRDFLPHVFERFTQADGTKTRRHGGLGLGLSIVRHLVEMHGGNVRAESEGPGTGATFTVSLPIVAVRRSRRPVRGEQVTLPPRLSLRGLRVLVAEDDADSRRMLESLFTRSGAAVMTARSAAEALECLGQQEFDVLVSDIAMPGGDGYELIRAVREREKERGDRVHAIALTAHAHAEDRKSALSAGFHVHLAKPIDPEQLIMAVAAARAGLPEA